MRRSLGISLALATVGRPALEKAGILETSPKKRGFLEVAYLGGWWLIAVIVSVLPTYTEEPLFYFPAILALSVAWLVTMPSYGLAVANTDFSLLRPPQGTWAKLIEAMQKQRVPVPDVLRTDEAQATVDAVAPSAFPVVMPLVLLQGLRWLSGRAAYVALFGMVGLLTGPFLASIHWWRGWSPVSLLYALSAPSALILIASLLMPAFVQAFVAGLRADRDLEQLFKAANGASPVPEDATTPSRARPGTRSTRVANQRKRKT